VRPISEIGRAIQDHAEANGFEVVRAFVGHGIGEQFHTDLQIPHYHEPRLDPGHRGG
jgi:methionyl aminopeptidase